MYYVSSTSPPYNNASTLTANSDSMYYYCICITFDQYAATVKPDPDSHSPSLFYATKISNLMRIHRSAWGTDRIPVPYMLWVTTALLTLLPNLSNPQNRDAFINLAVAAKAFARRWAVGKAKLELVMRRAKEMGVEWPVEIGPLFADDSGAGAEASSAAPKRVKVGR